MTTKKFTIDEDEMMYVDNYTNAVLRNLKAQGAPIGDDLKLKDGWQMTWKRNPDTQITHYRIFDKDE